MYKVSSILALFIVVCLSSCTNGGSSSSSAPEPPKSPQQLRAELKQQEELDPLSYLSDQSVTMDPQQKKIRNGGLFRDPEYAPDGAIFTGFINNSASIAQFKDVRVKISYYSKTKTLIEEKSYVIYEYFPANTTTPFTFKVDEIPEAQESFSFQIIGATASE